MKGKAGAIVGKYPKTSATGGALTLVAIGAGGTKVYDKKIEKFDKEDKASVGIGAAGGAALMPMRAPKPRGSRKDQITQLAADVKAAGGEPGKKVDIDLNPSQATRVSEKSGIRAQNGSYSAKMTLERDFPTDKKYETALYEDGSTRQLGGRHFLAARAMKGENVPTRVHVQSGSRPAEPTAVQALMRPLKGMRERRDLANQISSPEATLERRAKRHVSGRINGQIARVADKEGEFRVKPGLSVKDVKRLHAKQAAYVVGGAGLMYGGNLALRGEKTSPTKAITSTADKYSDKVRNKAADVLDPDEVKKRDKDRYAAGAAGATAGAAVMPVRDAGGHYDKKFAQKYASGIKQSGDYDIKSKDLQTIAAPGRRPKNIDYTIHGGNAIHEGKWNPDPITVRLYDDAGKTAGGAHRTQARAYAQQEKQRVHVERVKGYYPETRPGAEAAIYRARRVIQPTRFKRATPKSVEELKSRAAQVPQSVVDDALKHATDSPHAPSKPGLTRSGLNRLHGKQAAIMAGGAGLALGANEYRRNNVSKIAPKAPRKINFHPIRTRTDRRIAETSRLAGQNFTQGVADSVKANMPKIEAPDIVGAAKKAGAVAGGGAAAGGLLAGAGKVIGDAVSASATNKAAKEATKRSKIYAGSGVAGAGMIGTGIAFNRRKS
jgi:hypothetical protein